MCAFNEWPKAVRLGNSGALRYITGMAPQLAMLNANAIREAANADFEFVNAARFWNAVIAIDTGPDRYVLEMKDGRIARFGLDRSRGSRRDLLIAAPSESWTEFLKPEPRPFFHDLFAAMSREGFVLEGNSHEWGPYYPALRRFFEIVRRASS